MVWVPCVCVSGIGRPPGEDLAARADGIGCRSPPHGEVTWLPWTALAASTSVPSGEGTLGCRVPALIATLTGGNQFRNELDFDLTSDCCHCESFCSSCKYSISTSEKKPKSEERRGSSRKF